MAAWIRAKHGTWGFAGKRFTTTAVLIEDETIIEVARADGYCEVTDAEPEAPADHTADSGVFSTKDADKVIEAEPETPAEPEDEPEAEKPKPAPKTKKAPAKKAEKAE